jgi:hypothetical protein
MEALLGEVTTRGVVGGQILIDSGVPLQILAGVPSLPVVLLAKILCNGTALHQAKLAVLHPGRKAGGELGEVCRLLTVALERLDGHLLELDAIKTAEPGHRAERLGSPVPVQFESGHTEDKFFYGSESCSAARRKEG